MELGSGGGKKEDQKQGDHHREFKDDLRMKASLKISVIQLSDTETSEQRFKVRNALLDRAERELKGYNARTLRKASRGLVREAAPWPSTLAHLKKYKHANEVGRLTARRLG